MSVSLEILFEDSDLLVLNKPSGWLSEGGRDNQSDIEKWASEQWGRDICCCHRLDRLTSGAILLRKNRRLLSELAELFEHRRIRKSYWALVKGTWPNALTKIEKPIGIEIDGSMRIDPQVGKPSRTGIRIRGRGPKMDYTWLELMLKTGRRHQARLHCADAGHPILGDVQYGGPKRDHFFGLHARNLRFRYPGSGEEINVTTSAPVGWGKYLANFDA